MDKKPAANPFPAKKRKASVSGRPFAGWIYGFSQVCLINKHLTHITLVMGEIFGPHKIQSFGGLRV